MSSQHQVNLNSTVGRWSELEHQLFLSGLQVYGKNWKEISKLVGTRSGAQIRSHAQKYFERKNKSNSSAGSDEAEGEKNERLSTTMEGWAFCEEEVDTNFSYFFCRISKYLKENNKLCFWEAFIGGPSNNSEATQFHEMLSKKSFQLFSEPIIENETTKKSKVE